MKKFLSLILALALCLGLSVPATAVEESVYVMNGDTIDLTPEAYEEQLTNVTCNKSITNSEKIKAVCETFLALRRASMRDHIYDCRELVSNKGIAKMEQPECGLLSADEAQSQFKKITSDKIVFSEFSTEIEEDVATANVVEEYSYYLDEGFDDDYNYRRVMYMFSLEKDKDGSWKIVDAYEKSPWEISKSNTDMPESKVEVYNTGDVRSPSVKSPDLMKVTYKTGKAVEYAKKWYSAKNQSTANPLFGYASANCQNFASQCVWAGFHNNYAAATSTTAWPAVSIARAGNNAPNVWCRNQSISLYSNYKWNWAWDNVQGFAHLIETSSMKREGPVGVLRTGLAMAEVGDVIYWTDQQTPNSSNILHAMFVTSVTGISGYRTAANIKIAANNSSTDSAYQSLSTYATGYSDSQFLVAHITCEAYNGSEEPIV